MTFLLLYTIEAPRIRTVTGPFSKFFPNGNNIFYNEATVGENCLTSVGWVTKYARTTIKIYLAQKPLSTPNRYQKRLFDSLIIYFRF